MITTISISSGKEWSICVIDGNEHDINIDIREEFTVDEIMFLLGVIQFGRYQLDFTGYFIGDTGLLDFYGEVLGKEVVICDIKSKLVGWQLCFNLYFEALI